MLLNVAAALLVVLGVLHSWLGERYLLMRLFRQCELPKLLGGTEFTKNTLRSIWHFVTVTGFGIAVALVQLGDGGSPQRLAITLGWTCIVSGLLPLFFTRGRHVSWVVLFAAGALCLVWAGR